MQYLLNVEDSLRNIQWRLLSHQTEFMLEKLGNKVNKLKKIYTIHWLSGDNRLKTLYYNNIENKYKALTVSKIS